MINKTISLCIHNRKCWNAQFGSVTSKTNLKCSFLGLWNQTLGFIVEVDLELSTTICQSTFHKKRII